MLIPFRSHRQVQPRLRIAGTEPLIKPVVKDPFCANTLGAWNGSLWLREGMLLQTHEASSWYEILHL